MYVLKGATQEHRDLTRSATSDDGELTPLTLDARAGDTPHPGADAGVDWGLDQLPTSFRC